MPRPLLVFDLDGTLVDTAHDLIGALNASLEAEAIDPVPVEMVGHLVGHGGRALVEKALTFRQVPAGAAKIERMIQVFLKHYGENVAIRSRPYPGVLAALDRFEAAGWDFAVCTNKPQSLSDQLLATLGLTPRLKAVCGGDAFAMRKPDPAHLLGTIARAGGDPARAIMVGDSRSDIDAAKNAGIPVIAVTFGYTDVPVAKLGPDVVIDHFDELWDAVAGLKG